MGESTVAFLVLLLVAGVCQADKGANTYYGRLIGSLESQYHGIRGDVYAVDARTLFIKGFSYDGKGQDAIFYAGSSSRVGTDGFVVPNEDGSTEGLSRSYQDQDLTLTLPEGKTIKEIRWLTVWSRSFSEAFGEVRVPAGFDYPRPQRLTAMSGIHKVSSDRIYVVDAQTFLLPNFTYDGAAPDAFFWVGTGSKPGQEGHQVPDENGKVDPLRRYDTKTLVLTLPGDLTVFDVEWLSIWCRAYGIDFGHIRIPKNLNVPPSLKMLGVAPQAKLNCEVLWDDLALEVRWAVAGETIVLQLVGKIDDGQYVSFGPSGDSKKTKMIGADVAVGWLDRASGKGFVHDHYITSKGSCSSGKGVCQDTLSPRGANNIRLLNAALVNDYVMLTYQRPLKAQDDQDKSIITNGTQAVIWAVGPLSSANEPTYHKLRNKGDLLIDFGRSPFWNCPAPEDPTPSSIAPPTIRRPAPASEDNSWTALDGNVVGSKSQLSKSPVPSPLPPPVANKPPWYIPAIECNEPENHVFYAHLGPTGGAQGYNAITGQVGWGISWFINGLLIPEVTVVRGQTYTFVVEGGQDPDRPSRYHPFYITDDPEGGYEFKTPAERSKIKVFAGVTYDRDGHPAPSAQGRLCEWVEDPSQPPEKFSSFGAFQRTLKLHCEEGEPAIMQFKPDENTPDTVYYQCYTHRFLGWKIRVVDDCDLDNSNRKVDVALQPAAPFNHASKRPSEDAVEHRGYEEDDYEDDIPRIPQGQHSKNGAPPKNVDFAVEHRTPSDGFFPENPFAGNFPSDFGDFFKDSPFVREEKKRPTPPPPPPPQRLPPPPPKATKTAAPVPKPTELPPVIVKAEGQQTPATNVPGPLKQLTKLINHASNFNQQPNIQNHQAAPRDPLRNQGAAAAERPSPQHQDRPAWVGTSNEQQNPSKEKIPTRIIPPPVQQPYNQGASATQSVVQRPFYHHQNDQYGGVFNPNTIILESGFKPIRKADGPMPPLGFEVEGQHTVSKGVVIDDPRVTSEPPSLVTLDPVFIASEPDHRRVQEPVPITLPKAVVPVVPGPSVPVSRFPPPSANNNPQFRQTPLGHQNRHPQSNERNPAPPQRKKSGFASFFNFGSQRRREQQHSPPAASPVAVVGPSPPRHPLHPQPHQVPQGPQLQRLHPSAGQHRPGDQLFSLQQRHQQDEQLKNLNANSAAPNRPRPQQPQLENRNTNSALNRPASPPQSRPQHGLTGLLQRFLGGGDRRKETPAPEIIFPPIPPRLRPALNGRGDSPSQSPISFQGPLPPIIATKIQSAQRPNFEGLRRSDQAMNQPNVLDQFSASIIGGGPVMGLPGIPAKTVINEAERAQLERFLFGPAEHYTPRSFPAGSFLGTLEDMLSGDISTDSSVDENTEEPDLSTSLAMAEENNTADDVHAEDNALAEESGGEESESESKSRKKRQVDNEEHQDEHQHLGQLIKDLDSSRLPVEHRGLDDDDSHEHHNHSGSTQLLACWYSVTWALLLFVGLTRIHYF